MLMKILLTWSFSLMHNKWLQLPRILMVEQSSNTFAPPLKIILYFLSNTKFIHLSHLPYLSQQPSQSFPLDDPQELTFHDQYEQ